MSDIYDLLIIGGGPAGLTAAIYASRAGLRYLMLDKGYPGGQVANTDMVDNYPGLPGISGIDLAGKLLEHAENMGMELVMDEVTDLDVGDEIKTVHTLGGEYRAHNLLLCTGASPRKLGVPGEEAFRGRGVSYCATCDGAFFRGKKTVVIGGGDTALQDALYLSAFCESVTLVHRRDAFRGNDQLQKKLPQHQNIHLEMSSTALAIEGTDRVSGVRLSTPSGEKLIPADGVRRSSAEKPIPMRAVM